MTKIMTHIGEKTSVNLVVALGCGHDAAHSTVNSNVKRLPAAPANLLVSCKH